MVTLRQIRTALTTGWQGGVAVIRRHMGLTTVLLAALFLLVVHQRTLTYVCGNDPMLYMRAARVVLQPQLYGRDALVHSLTFVAPGYTLLLAATIKVFGDTSPYWLNLALLLAALPLMWTVLRRLMGSDRAASFAILWSWVILLGGHALHAAYLFHPFREAPVVFCVYAAYTCLLRAAGEGRRGAWAAGAALSLIAACAFREPSVFIAASAALGLPWLVPTWRERARLGGWFLLPWVVLAMAAIVALQVLGYAGSSQFAATKYLRDTSVAVTRMREMLGWIPSEAGWIGAACMALGIVRAAWRSPLLVVWFLLPAVFLFVFYAHMQMHVRYFLAAFLYAVVFAGYGLDGLLRLLEHGVGLWSDRRHDRRGVRMPLLPTFTVVTTMACFVVLVTLMVRVALQAHPWGPRLSAHHVRRWQTLVAQLEPAADGRVRIAVEQRCRYLEDLLLSYTDAELLDPKRIRKWPSTWAPAHFFDPLNRQALYATPQWLMYLSLNARRLLGDRMDVLPAGAGTPRVHTIGRGEYAQYVLRPWTAEPHPQDFTLKPATDQVLWLDWGMCASGATRTVTIRNAQTGAPWFSHTMQGNGLQAIFLPGHTVDGPQGVLSTHATDPVPSRPLFDVVDAALPKTLTFGVDRRVSLQRLLLGLDADSLREYPLSVRGEQSTALRVPELHADAGGDWLVSFRGDGGTQFVGFSLGCRHQDGSETVRAITAGNEAGAMEMGSGETVELILKSAQGPVRDRWHIRRISLQYRPAQQQGG